MKIVIINIVANSFLAIYKDIVLVQNRLTTHNDNQIVETRKPIKNSENSKNR